MIAHVVFFRLKKDNKEENRERMIKDLKSLPAKIDTIVEYEVGANLSTSDKSSDICLYSKFNNEQDLEGYRIHPEHQKLLEFILAVTEEIRVVDYEVQT